MEETTTHRTRTRELLSDSDIENQEKLNNHKRRQRLLDSATWIGIFFLYLAAVAVVIFVIALACNFFVNDQWDKIEEYTRTILIALLSFIFGVLSDQVIKKQQG